MGGISSAKGDGRRGAPANGTHGTDRTQYGAKNETPPYGQEYIGWTAGRQGAGASLKAAHNGQDRARERTGVLRRTPRAGKLSDDDAKGRTGRRERSRIRGTTGAWEKPGQAACRSTAERGGDRFAASPAAVSPRERASHRRRSHRPQDPPALRWMPGDGRHSQRKRSFSSF